MKNRIGAILFFVLLFLIAWKATAAPVPKNLRPVEYVLAERFLSERKDFGGSEHHIPYENGEPVYYPELLELANNHAAAVWTLWIARLSGVQFDLSGYSANTFHGLNAVERYWLLWSVNFLDRPLTGK